NTFNYTHFTGLFLFFFIYKNIFLKDINFYFFYYIEVFKVFNYNIFHKYRLITNMEIK
ncbi:hypothetical protein DB41_FD00010, partial [Neochlamydia sp. TUME1]